MVRLEHVNKFFNRRKKNEIHVINDTTLQMESKGLVALLGPLIHLRGAELDFSVSEHLAETAQKEEEYRNAQNDTFSLLIKERCEAYIEAAAQEMGLEVHTRVALQESEEGIPQPSEVWLDIPYHASLSAQITQELGIAEQYQSWGTKEMG